VKFKVLRHTSGEFSSFEECRMYSCLNGHPRADSGNMSNVNQMGRTDGRYFNVPDHLFRWMISELRVRDPLPLSAIVMQPFCVENTVVLLFILL
jgi:hypothetical protein